MVHRCDRRDDIEGPPERVGHHVAAHPLDSLGFASCPIQHCGIGVDRRHVVEASGQVDGQEPVTGSHVEC